MYESYLSVEHVVKISLGSVQWFRRNHLHRMRKLCFEKNAFEVFFSEKS